MIPSKLQTRLFREHHFDLFDCRPEYRAAAQEDIKRMDWLGQQGQCGCQMHDGRILYIAAWFNVAPGVVEVFLVPSIHVLRFPKLFLRDVKWWLEHLLSDPATRRIQTWGLDTPESANWLAHIGFEREGTLYSYGQNGESMLIWGMTKCKQ